MDSEFLEQMHGRIVRNFLDMVILMEMRKHSMSAHDVINFVNDKFHVLLGSGTVYSNLYFLEKKGLIESDCAQRDRVYTLSERGRETVKAFLNARDKILGLVLNLFLDE